MSFSSDNPQITNQLETTVDFTGDKPLFLDTLTNTYRKISSTVNTKTGGLYQPTELSNSEQFFTPSNPQKQRNVYRMTVDFGPLPNNTTKTISHGINFTSEFALTKVYGASSDPTGLQYIPLPYVSVAGNSIELLITSSTVTIITNSNRSNFKITYIVIEYCKTQ